MTELEKKQQDILRQIEEKIAELKNVKATLANYQQAMKCAEFEISIIRRQNDSLMRSLKDCANELCQKCGQYESSHLGSCGGCKWKDARNLEVDDED